MTERLSAVGRSRADRFSSDEGTAAPAPHAFHFARLGLMHGEMRRHMPAPLNQPVLFDGARRKVRYPASFALSGRNRQTAGGAVPRSIGSVRRTALLSPDGSQSDDRSSRRSFRGCAAKCIAPLLRQCADQGAQLLSEQHRSSLGFALRVGVGAELNQHRAGCILLIERGFAEVDRTHHARKPCDQSALQL